MEGAQKEPCLSSWAVPAACAAMLLLTGRSPALNAQSRAEARLDAIVDEKVALHAAVGVLFPLGTYLRSGVVVGAGIAKSDASFRADVVNAFHADPFRESRWAPYGGGGVSFRHDAGSNETNTVLLVFLGVEGPPRGRFAPAFELGLGGGVRVGIIARRAREGAR